MLRPIVIIAANLVAIAGVKDEDERLQEIENLDGCRQFEGFNYYELQS